MAAYLFKIEGHFDEFGELIEDIGRDLPEDGHVFLPWVPRGVGYAGCPASIIVGLGSAGVFSALFQIISTYLTRNNQREITLEKDDKKITLKGHSLPEEQSLINEFFGHEARSSSLRAEHETKDDIPNKPDTGDVK